MRMPRLKMGGFFFLCAAFLCLSLPPYIHAKDHLTKVIYWHGDENYKKIALTFDDGPNKIYTTKVLDTLKEHGIKATFFMIGKFVEDNPEIAKRAIHEGHAVGNHTYTHPDLKFEPARVINYQIEKANEIIHRTTGKKPFLFRPPYGAHTAKIIAIAKRKGYFVIEYSVSSTDGGKTWISAEKIVKVVLPKIKNGSIILMHDGDRFDENANRSATVEALPVLIKSLQEKGYKFVTIPELLNLNEKSAEFEKLS